VRDTWNTSVIDALEPEPGDLELYETRLSGFHGTELAAVWMCALGEACSAEPEGADLPGTNHEASLLVREALFGWVSDSGALLRAPL
jgi:hypothetical protein